MKTPQASFAPFLILWTGQLLSNIGSGVSAFALGVCLFEGSSSTTAYSLLLLAAFGPATMVAPLGGILADRHDRRRIMAAADLCAALAMLAIIGMTLLLPAKNWPIYLGVTIISLCMAFHAPTFKASVSDLIHEQAYARASGLVQLAEASRHLLAPAIAGLLISRVSLAYLLAIDTGTFILAALTTLSVRKQMRFSSTALPRQEYRQDFITGIRYLAKTPSIRSLLLLTILITFLVGVLHALMAPLVLCLSDAGTLGSLQSLAASGALLSSLLMSVFGSNTAPARTLCFSLGAAGLFYCLFGTCTTIAGMTITTFGFFLTLPFINTSLEVLFRQRIPNQLQGRIWSLITCFSQTGMLLAFGAAGWLAEQFFNPLLTDTGRWAPTVGRVMGTGAVRGSGLLLLICGGVLILCTLAAAIRRGRPKVPAIPG